MAIDSLNNIPTAAVVAQPVQPRRFYQIRPPFLDHIVSWGKAKRSKRARRRYYDESDELEAAECLLMLARCDGGYYPSPSAPINSTANITAVDTPTATDGAWNIDPTTTITAMNIDPTTIMTTLINTPTTTIAAVNTTPTTTTSATNDDNRKHESSPTATQPPVRHSPHKCNICGKAFTTHQALGGHKTLHRKKPTTASVDIAATASNPIVSVPNPNGSPHKCSICGETFSSGQALGGHKRKHYDGINIRAPRGITSFQGDSGSTGVTFSDCGAAGCTYDGNEQKIPWTLDLNFPPPSPPLDLTLKL